MAVNDNDSNGQGGAFVAARVGDWLDCVPNVLKRERFEDITARATAAGHWALLAVALLGFLIQLVATSIHGFSAFLVGLGWLVALPLLQYTAVQFMTATRSLVQSNETTLGSQAFLRSYALLALVVALISVIVAVARGLDGGSLQAFLFGLGMAALSLATAWLALNPALLGIRINSRTGAGEEAIGVLSFFVKTGVRLVPIFYGVALVIVAIHALVILLGMIGDSQRELVQAILTAELSAPLAVWAVLSPFLAYVGFVIYFLVIDLMRSILSLRDASGGSGGGSRKKTASSGRGARKKRSASGSASKKKASASTGGEGGTSGG